MFFLKILLSRYFRATLFLLYSLVYFVLMLLFPSHSFIFFSVYFLGILAFIILYNFSFPLAKTILSDFVEIVFTKIYDFPNKREFFSIVKDVFGVLNINVSNLYFFMDMGKGVYELLGNTNHMDLKEKEIRKDHLLLSNFISSYKVRLPFVDMKNTTLLPRDVFENILVLMKNLNTNFLLPVYSPNFDLIGVVLFKSGKISFKKLFYLSQFINIIGIMFKTINETETKKVLEEDIKIASQIQNKLVPTNYITNRWFESQGVYIPAYNIGGDYLDIIDKGRSFLFAVGDVAGKGISAGLIAIMVKAILNSMDLNSKNLSHIVKNLNYYIYRWLYDEESILTFITLFIGNYVPSSGKLYYTNAGHVPCMIVKGNEIITLHSSSRPLGLFEEIDAKKEVIDIKSGDILVLYTDGLIEQIDKRGREFGINRLKQILLDVKSYSPKEIVEIIMGKLREFSQEEIDDDVCILVVKFK